MAAPGGVKLCETPGCNKEARLQCPTCIKLGIEGSFFCNQVNSLICIMYATVG